MDGDRIRGQVPLIGGGDRTPVIINIPPSSPVSPRLAHLRPPSPLTPEAMRRINLLTVQEGPIDASKLSPISPMSYATSDLGSSPRSSLSVTTSSSSSSASAWSAYRESKKSSSDFTDADSDCCKDLFSPSIMLSPAPFSPFSDHPDIADTPAFSDPTSTPMGQRLKFSFDPKSPSFLPLATSRSSHFLLPPTPSLGPTRERSRSDSDTTNFLETSRNEPKNEQEKGEITTTSSSSMKMNARRQVEGHKHLYKKRLLRKYTEETSGDNVVLAVPAMKLDESTCEIDQVDDRSIEKNSVAMTIALTSPSDEEDNSKPSYRTALIDQSSNRSSRVSNSSPKIQSSLIDRSPSNNRSYLIDHSPTNNRSYPIDHSVGDNRSSQMDHSPSNNRSSLIPNALPQVCLPTIVAPSSNPTSPMMSPFPPPPSAPVSPTNLSSSFGLFTSGSAKNLSSSYMNPPTSTSTSIDRDDDTSNLRRSIESANLSLMRGGVGPNLSTQPYFGLWLKQQLLAANTLWYSQEHHRSPNPTTSLPPPPQRPLFRPPFPTSPSVCSLLHYQQQLPNTRQVGPDTNDPSPVPSSTISLDSKCRPQQHHANTPTCLAVAASIGPVKSRRSRSESDVSYVCQQCGQSFSLHDRLAKHVASRHRDLSGSRDSPLRSHKCNVCHKAFGRSDMLTRHMRLHTGIKPYACRVCGQVFSRSDHLSTHHRTHTGEKPYQCPQCPYAASRRDMITRHMRTHSRSNYPDRQSSSPSSSSSSSSGAPTTNGALDELPPSNIGYVSVIRHSLDRALLGDSAQSSDPANTDREESGSQLTTPRLSVGSSGRTSNGSASTVICAKDDDAMSNQDMDEKELSPSSLSVCKEESNCSSVLCEKQSSNLRSPHSPSNCTISVSPTLSTSSMKAHGFNGDSVSQLHEMVVKLEPSS